MNMEVREWEMGMQFGHMGMGFGSMRMGYGCMRMVVLKYENGLGVEIRIEITKKVERYVNLKMRATSSTSM